MTEPTGETREAATSAPTGENATSEGAPPLSRRAARAGAAIAQPERERFSLADAVGGPRGVVEAVLPGLLFVSWFTVTEDLRDSLVVAVGAAVVLVAARLVTRSGVTQALSGLVGVVLCAVVAARTGRAEDFYLLGFLTNIAYAAVYAVSTVRWPRIGRVPAWGPFPVIGLLLGPLLGEGLAWRRDPPRLRAYVLVTWLWVGMFLLRLAVQLPLYAAGSVAALGVARLVMGVPLFALTAWLTWMVLRAVPTTGRDGDGTEQTPGRDRGHRGRAEGLIPPSHRR